MRRVACLIAWCCLPVFSACNQSTSVDTAKTTAVQTTGGVAVIDLDEVARRIGRETAIKQALAEQETNLNQQLELMRVSYVKQVNQRKQQLTEEPASGNPEEIQTLEQQATARIRQAQQQAQSQLGVQRREMINDFREEVKPIASAAAAERGLSLVISKNDTVLFSFDSAVDITQAVIERMLSHTSSALPAPNGALPEPNHLPQMPQQAIRGE